ncbi:MAG: hypothetical protein R3Y65_06630 [Bacillota bacterium]
MSLWSNVTDWAKDTASSVGSAVKSTTSNIGDWMEEKYNNAKTALTISTPTTPSTYLTGGSVYDDSSTGYNGIPKTSYSSSSNSSSSSSNNSSSVTSNNSSASSNSSSNSATLAAYEALLAKTTAIENIQKSLNTVKQTDYNGEELKVDGDFGIKTQYAWDSYLQAKGVPNYLAGIATTQKTPSYYYNNQPNTSNISTVKESTISPLSDDAYIYTGSMWGDLNKNVLNDVDTSNLINNLISSTSSGIDASKIFDSTNNLLNNNVMQKTAKYGSKAISKLMTAVDISEAATALVNGDFEQTLVSVGGIIGGIGGAAIGATVASAGSGGILAVVGGTMGAVAGAELGEMAGQWIYDSGKWIYEKFT